MNSMKNKKKLSVKSVKQECDDVRAQLQRLEYMIEIMQPVVDAAIAYTVVSAENKPTLKREQSLRTAAHECAIKLAVLKQDDYSI